MSSRGTDKLVGQSTAPVTKELPHDIALLRKNLRGLMDQTDAQGRKCGACTWGIYAFYDFDGEPIYVGQTKEKIGGRVGRHLTGQRSDAVAMRILDPLEVAEVEVWPLWDLAGVKSKTPEFKQATLDLDALEYSVWYAAIKGSKFGAIFNEKRPPSDKLVELPESFRGQLYSGEELSARTNADVRIARRAETVSRLADVARERGQVSAGLRRTLALQTIRLAYLASVRSAVADGRPIPSPSAIDSIQLVGSQLDLAVVEQEDDDDE